MGPLSSYPIERVVRGGHINPLPEQPLNWRWFKAHEWAICDRCHEADTTEQVKRCWHPSTYNKQGEVMAVTCPGCIEKPRVDVTIEPWQRV